MADMSFLNKLTPEQESVANMIADRAIAMGVDPRLAVSLAYRESQFNPNAKGSSGEIGVMQVMPATGKGMGFSEKDLADPAKNIDAGLTYLKQQLDRFNDPVAAAAAYNAGPGHPFFKDPDNKELPASTMQYLEDIKKLGGFTTTQPAGDAEPEAAPEAEKAPVEVSDFDKKRATVDALAALAGAGVGGTAGGAKAVFNRMFPPPGSGVERGARPAGAPAGGLIPTDPQNVRIQTGTVEEGTTGRARQTGYTERTSQEAARRAEMERIRQQLVAKGLISPDNVMAKMPGMTSTPGGILIPSGAAYPPAPPAPPAPKSALSRVGSAALGAAGAALRNPVLTGALAGVGTAELGMQALNRYKTDPLGAGIAGLGALGSAAAMIPTAPTRIIGGGLAMASPAALYLLDKMRAARQQPVPAQ